MQRKYSLLLCYRPVARGVDVCCVGGWVGGWVGACDVDISVLQDGQYLVGCVHENEFTTS